jgi:hypothetical protein
MGTLHILKPGPVQLLWAPRKGVNEAWRVGAVPAVLQFQSKALAPAAAPYEPYRRPVESELVQNIRREIESIVEHEDERFGDYISDCYADCIADNNQIIKEIKS